MYVGLYLEDPCSNASLKPAGVFAFNFLLLVQYLAMNPLDVIEKAKDIAGLVRKYNDLELYQKIVDLQGEMVKLSTRNFELETKCAELKAELDQKKSVVHSRLLYYAADDPTPFCPYCFEKDGKLLHLSPVELANSQEGRARWDCFNCYHSYFAKSLDAPFVMSFDDQRYHWRKMHDK